MFHALDALDHALRGEPTGLSFLEQTASIYVLDATTPGHPTTYGWWNFLNNALNEVERYEEGASLNNPVYASVASGSFSPSVNTNPLDPHVRLLATITRRMARRPSSSDRRLISTCLANASSAHLTLLANPETTRALLQNNEQLRERDMGRIAAIVFDYSFHCQRQDTNRIQSAFSDPVVMEMMCGVIAANAVSSGPNAVRHLVSNWIVPSCDALPSFSVAAILDHVARETMGKVCPLGIRELIKECSSVVFVNALGPLLTEALRESEDGDESIRVNSNHRTAAAALKAFNSWCKATSIGAVQLRNIFSSTNINILDATADALYSNSERVIDAVSDLIDTVLKIDSLSNHVSSGLSIAQAVMSSALSSSNLLLAQQVAGDNTKARRSILSELIYAVGLQRLRFTERQHKGDIEVCRCLTKTAARVLVESKDFVTSGELQVSLNGLFDLLFKAISHPSIDVCGIALEAFLDIAPSNTELATRLLPYLQGKAIIPFQFTHHADGFEEFLDFRDNLLADALIACYTGCSLFYLTSCGSAIEEFCQASTSPHIPHQLEAALFCLVAISDTVERAVDKQVFHKQLENITSALKRNAFSTTSNPFVMARMCSFIGHYATSLAQCQHEPIFEMACELVIASFNLSVTECETTPFPSAKVVSVMSGASDALKHLLCSAPSRFSAPAALTVLESAWNLPYAGKRIDLEDREALCKGLCVVIASLPPDKHDEAINKLTQPILSFLNVATKEVDTNVAEKVSILQRLANEIRLLASVVTHFVRTDAQSRFNSVSAMLQKSWQILVSVSNITEEVIANAILDLLKAALSLYRSNDDIILLQEACELAKTVVIKSKASAPSFLSFVKCVVETHGEKAEKRSNDGNSEWITIRDIIKHLMVLSFDIVQTLHATSEQSNSTPQDIQGISDIMSHMYKTLSTCAAKCPFSLLNLSREDQPVGELILSTIHASPNILNVTEVEVSSSAIHFLKALTLTLNSLELNQLETTERQVVITMIEKINHIIQTNVISSSVAAICGTCPQEVIMPFSSLIHTILQFSRWEEVQPSVASVLVSCQFKLGDECRHAVLEILRRCTETGYPASNFGDLTFDLWSMHQTDDSAGGQVVHDFITKYHVNR